MQTITTEQYWLIEEEEEEEEESELSLDNEDEAQEHEDVNQEETSEAEEESKDELDFSFGEPEEEKQEEGHDTGLVKHLRKTIREQTRRLKELESKAAPAEIKLPPRPTLADCDYDEDEYNNRIDAWMQTKSKVEAQQKQQKDIEEQQRKSFDEKLQRYNDSKTMLNVRNYEDAEDNVRDSLNEIQQGAIIQLAAQPEKLVYALGNNQAQLKRLSEIKDPAQFIWELSKLESKLQTKPAKPATAPEGRVSGSATLSATTDRTLANLEKEAEKTGDRTKVIQYKRQLKNKGK